MSMSLKVMHSYVATERHYDKLPQLLKTKPSEPRASSFPPKERRNTLHPSPIRLCQSVLSRCEFLFLGNMKFPNFQYRAYPFRSIAMVNETNKTYLRSLPLRTLIRRSFQILRVVDFLCIIYGHGHGSWSRVWYDLYLESADGGV